MSFSSRRRNYLLVPHRKDGLIAWMKNMLNHSFVLDALESTAEDTFHHFEELIDEHRLLTSNENDNDNIRTSRLKQLVPTVNTFHTHLPLKRAFVAYNKKYALTKRKHITISFNEIRHICNLAQVMALRGEDEEEQLRTSLKDWEKSPGIFKDMVPSSPPNMSLGAPAILPPTNSINSNTGTSTMMLNGKDKNGTSNDNNNGNKSNEHEHIFKGPKMITFDGDQTLYSDGANFDQNPELANYLYLLLRHGVTIAVVTAAGYEYATEKYELRLSGLLAYFKEKKLPLEDCQRFYLFGGECNYLLVLGEDYKLHPVKEHGPGGWMTATKFIKETPGNWSEDQVKLLLDVAEASVKQSVANLRLRGRVIRKKRSVGLIPTYKQSIPREALDESVLTAQEKLDEHTEVKLPFCAFNGGSDVWVDVGNKRVGVHILSAYLGMPKETILHIGDQFLNTGNDFAARDICPCCWITSPDETTYVLKTILRLSGLSLEQGPGDDDDTDDEKSENKGGEGLHVNLKTVASRNAMMDVYTGEMFSEN